MLKMSSVRKRNKCSWGRKICDFACSGEKNTSKIADFAFFMVLGFCASLLSHGFIYSRCVQSKTIINERQKKVLNKLLDGFDGKLTSMKWAKIAKCSKESAIRDINDLINKEVLQKESAGGRSTSYVLKN